MKSLYFMYSLLIPSVAMAQKHSGEDRIRIATEMETSIRSELLNKWYPQCIDSLYGGFISTFTFDFKPTGPQDKCTDTQARHTWSTSKATVRYPDIPYYKTAARHGYNFLRDVMWDKTYGGFYTLVNRMGTVKDSTKNAYGNAFGIYALAAYFACSHDSGALKLAQEAFLWLEKHSHDTVHKGYFQHLQQDGTPIQRTPDTPSNTDLGYKDQNSSIHLLEAFTELYDVWPDPLLHERLHEMLLLIRDTMVTKKGNLVLFFHPDWTPVSFRDSSHASVMMHRNLDHVSFGHDVETAYLMQEASHALGIQNDTTTLNIGKRMVDHALDNGWDNSIGGFYDEGYYFKDRKTITIIQNSKNWWAQAEGLNTLLIMSELFPNDPRNYFDKFKMLWKYAQMYLIDHTYGDWYEEGVDKEPQRKTAFKGHIWKATYHQFRALMNCVDRLKQG